MELGTAPDFERMYAIKIRGSEREIMEELAQFGHPDARFLDLRFVEVRRILGEPNQVGSVIRYSVPFAGLGTELHLTKRVRSGNLAVRDSTSGWWTTGNSYSMSRPPRTETAGSPSTRIRLQERHRLRQPDDLEDCQILIP